MLEIIDLTAQTGWDASGPTTSWQSSISNPQSEYLFAINSLGMGGIFRKQSGQNWQLETILQNQQHQMVAPFTYWNMANVDHLAGRNREGELLVWWKAPEQVWQMVNVTRERGAPLIASPVTSWQTYNFAEHLAGISLDGNLIVFTYQPNTNWGWVDFTFSPDSPKISMIGESWLTRTGPGQINQHISAIGLDGSLIEFYRIGDGDWQYTNISSQFAPRPVLSAPVTAWQAIDGPNTVEHLAGVDRNQDLLVFFRIAGQNWQMVNVSQITQQKIIGSVTSWTRNDFAIRLEFVSGVGPDGALYVFWWTPGQDWQVMNMTIFTKQRQQYFVGNWLTLKRGIFGYTYYVQNLAGVTGDNHLMITSWSPGDLLTVRVKGIFVRDSNGSNPVNTDTGQMKLWVNKANDVFDAARIQFLFDDNPSGRDWDYLNDTLINNLYGDDPANRSESNRRRDYAMDKARQYRGKIPVFLRLVSQTPPPDTCGFGCGYSAPDLNFVVVPQFSTTFLCGDSSRQNIGLLAHELGHYLGLSHTFSMRFDNKGDAEAYFQRFNFSNVNVFDGDSFNDTPPDPLVKGEECSSSTTLTLSGTRVVRTPGGIIIERPVSQRFVLPRDNIMSYYSNVEDANNKTISPQQCVRARETLISRIQSDGLIVSSP